MIEFSTQTAGEIIKSDKHNAMLDHAFEKPASYIIRMNGAECEAIKGGTSSGAGMITYGGAADYGGVDGGDPAAVIQAVIDALTSGKILLKDGTYSLGSTALAAKQKLVIEGESRAGTILSYTGSADAIAGTDLDHFELKNLTVSLDTSPTGCVKIGENSTYAQLENVYLKSSDKTTSGQYGILFEATDNICYYNWVVDCLFETLNIGIKTATTGAAKANGQQIRDCIFYNIGATGIDFSADSSGQHTVKGGWWAFSANAVGFKSDGSRNIFDGCQLEMGTGSQAFQLLSNSAHNHVEINANCPTTPTDVGANNHVHRISIEKVFNQLTTPVEALADANRTSSNTWTDLDLSSHVPSWAKSASVFVRVSVDTVGSGTNCSVRLRKNGTTPDTKGGPNLFVDKAGITAGGSIQAQFDIGMDDSKIIEYLITVGTGWQIDTYIWVAGWYG